MAGGWLVNVNEGGGARGCVGVVGLYKKFIGFEAFVHESIVLLLHPPTYIAHAIAILSHDYCAIYALPQTPFVYAIDHTILVRAISC